MELHIDPQGRITCLYGEAIDLSALGVVSIRRASHVEPDERGRWWADLSPVAGPKLGPFFFRGDALRWEEVWFELHLTKLAEQF